MNTQLRLSHQQKNLSRTRSWLSSGLERDEHVVKEKREEQMRGIGYNMAHCLDFVCKSYEQRPFPYSESFLKIRL